MGGRGRHVDSSAPALYREVIDSLDDTFPHLAGAELEHYWSGCVAITADHIPHLHELAPGVHAGLGYNGRGVAMSTALGCLLARRAGGTPAAEIPFPVTEAAAVPFHALRRPAVKVIGWWRGLLDRIETRLR
jgi:glycine/D-amino acid oxidase-like deaminating enzyme